MDLMDLSWGDVLHIFPYAWALLLGYWWGTAESKLRRCRMCLLGVLLVIARQTKRGWVLSNADLISVQQAASFLMSEGVIDTEGVIK